MARLRSILVFLAAFLGPIGAVALFGWLSARAEPVVREQNITLADWPAGATPIRVALMSDIHVGSSVTSPARLESIVAQVNRANPDLVLIAGDFIVGDEAGSATTLGQGMIAPLRHLRAPLGVVAVPGNHDYWTGIDAVRAELAAAGIPMLVNQALVRGPLAIGGVSDEFTGHADVAATLAAQAKLPGAHVLLSHSPDIAPDLPADARLLLAGHTHCGQMMVPGLGPLTEGSRYGARYRCGIRTEGARTVVTSGGVGTSGWPFRFFTRPDIWVLTLGPQDARGGRE